MYAFHDDITDELLYVLIRRKKILYGGNRVLQIFGYLSCKSGKKMMRKNRIFFSSIKEAREAGYRPCAKCMPHLYRQWKRKHDR